MRHIRLTIKEKSGRVTREYMDDVTDDFVKMFFGLDDPDVESYKIEDF